MLQMATIQQVVFVPKTSGLKHNVLYLFFYKIDAKWN